MVLTHQAPPTSDVAPSVFADDMPDIFEKPRSKDDNLRMLLDLNGASCEVVTGVSVVYPVLQAPGYEIKSVELPISQFFYLPPFLGSLGTGMLRGSFALVFFKGP